MTSAPRTHRSTTAAGVALVGVLATVLSGCSATNQITTAQVYSASDGVRASLGDLTAENLLVISGGTDDPGALQGAFTNHGDDALTVTITSDGEQAGKVRVQAGATQLLGGTHGEDVVFDTQAAPGSLTTLTIETGEGGSQDVQVPVLDGTLPEYADLVPTATPTTDAS